MAKAILISIKPRYVRDILNGDKTIEIRKSIPKCDLPIDVYIYVTKDKKEKLFRNLGTKKYFLIHCSDATGFNGKVIAHFRCDKVEEHRPFFHWCIEKETCLTRENVLDYLDSKDKSVGNPKRQGKVYAIHITKLKIFGEPKLLNNFLVNSHQVSGIGFKGEKKTFTVLKPLTKAPQSWCFIEV